MKVSNSKFYSFISCTIFYIKSGELIFYKIPAHKQHNLSLFNDNYSWLYVKRISFFDGTSLQSLSIIF